MRKAILVAGLLCPIVSGCAGKRSCCATCGVIAAAVGMAALIGVADGAIDSAVDPKPTSTDTAEGKRKLWEWNQRQVENDY